MLAGQGITKWLPAPPDLIHATGERAPRSKMIDALRYWESLVIQLRLLLPVSIVACLASMSPALAWGQSGHSVIAELAQRHLGPAAHAKLKELIGDTSLASISNWADDYKFTPEGKNTYRWHFVDVDVERATYDANLDCKDLNDQGTCIVEGLPAAIAVLKDNSRSKDDRLRALKIVIHLAGDLEQPLHASERNGDQGGNKLHVVLHARRSDGTAYTKASTFPQHVGRLSGRPAGIFVGKLRRCARCGPVADGESGTI